MRGANYGFATRCPLPSRPGRARRNAEGGSGAKDPAAGYAALIAGDTTKGLAAWGQISYDTHMNYTANPITG